VGEIRFFSFGRSLWISLSDNYEGYWLWMYTDRFCWLVEMFSGKNWLAGDVGGVLVWFSFLHSLSGPIGPHFAQLCYLLMVDWCILLYVSFILLFPHLLWHEGAHARNPAKRAF
jgi:hypothetical protein